MNIVYHKGFEKSFNRLSNKQQDRIIHTIQLFIKDPFNPILKNHPLKGDMLGKRAIAAGGDLRIIFETSDNYQSVVFLKVGTHNTVY